MSAARDSTTQTPAVAGGRLPGSVDQDRRTLERGGHVVVASTDDVQRLSMATRDEPSTAVIVADRADLGRTAGLLGDISVLHPNCQIVVLHDVDDVHSASTALHHGARSCARSDDTFGDDSVPPDPSEAAHRLDNTVAEVLAAASVTDRSSAESIARQALDLATDGQTVDALAELCRIEGKVAALAAADHMTNTCAMVLCRVAGRTRFPIPLDYVMDRLCVPSDADVGLCYPLLQRAAFRSAGFDLDLEELATTHGHRGVLFGAFHSTRAVLQFLAERWWRTPRSILDELDTPRLDRIGHDGGLG